MPTSTRRVALLERSIEGIAKLISGAESYFIQGFVTSDNMIGSGFSAYSRAELEKFADIVRPHVKNISIRGVD